MADRESASPGSLERVRKAASFAAVTVFAVTFLALLVLSATPYWRPDNEFLDLCDTVWRISGVTALALGVIPYLRRLIGVVVGWISPES